MILSYSDQKFNTKTKVLLKCDKCGNLQYRPYKKYINLLKINSDFDMDYCEPCWVSIRQKSDKAKINMSNSLLSMIKKNPEWKLKNSLSKKGIINKGSSNGMKNPETAKKVSEYRKKLFKNPIERQKVSMAITNAWANGKYDGVRVGQCDWYEYAHSSGNVYKVQGNWELEFIKWLDKNKLKFKCHIGRIPYELNGVKKMYYPDFWIDEWNCWVDIKNDYHYSIQKEKFDILKSNGTQIKLIFKEELEKLINKRL
jgi:hypothetical protein